MNQSVNLSVIVPTCKRNNQLEQCLQRLQPGAQTLDATLYEVIVSDDSPNNEAVDLIQQEFSWVKYTPGPKRGPAANRNNGARLAAGQWLVFLDDDCLPDHGLLQAYISATQQEINCSVFEGIIKPERPANHPYEFAPIKLNAGSLWSCNFCIEKSAFNTISGFDEMFMYPHMEDKDFQLRLINTNFRFAFVSQAFVVHPWRTMLSGKNLGLREEMLIYFSLKHGIHISKRKILINTVYYYLSRLRFKNGINYFPRILIDFINHSTIILKHYSAWERKYLRLFQSR